jgi:hypothetical protein
MPAFTDPYNVAYAAVWDALEAYPAWSAAVNVGNRVDLTAAGGAVRRAVKRASGLPGDKRSLAELDLTTFRFVPSVNSRTSGVTQTFTLYLSDEVTRLANLETTVNDTQRLAGYQAVLEVVIEMAVPHHVVLAD